ncbi:type II secretion system protein [bacterium]|nr:type II secretion system protein [bacterium]MBU1993847.1 type II secretion system protein [bacterium]
MSKAFTMIEIIFVIVILGILAAIAVPKFAATRSDAEISRGIMSIGVIVADVTNYVVSNGTTSSDLSIMSHTANSLVNTSEATLDVGNKKVTIKIDNVDCVDISVITTASNENLDVRLVAAGSSNVLCQKVQDNIDVTTYNIPLRGSLVVE